MPKKFEEWHWEITADCNLSCIHCATDCREKRSEELSTNEALVAVKTMISMGCRRLMITGGGPLMRSDLQTVLEECKKKNIEVQLITNGVLVNKQTGSILQKFVSAVAISLDGANVELNDRLRSRGSFAGALNAISALRGKLPITVHITVSKANFCELDKIINFVNSLGIDKIHISEVTMAGRAQKNHVILALETYQRKWLKKFALKITGAAKVEDCCFADLSTLYMSSEGLVYPCTEVYLRRPDSCLGSIKSPALSENLNCLVGDYAGNLRKKCCYDIIGGNNFIFCLNMDEPCPLVKIVGGVTND
ncbi:MAG: radical SAM protein [Patescibacteria group bacterium]